MKSKGTIGLLILIILGTSVFTWMIFRPAIKVSAIQFGIPPTNTDISAKVEIEPQKQLESETEPDKIDISTPIELEKIDPVEENKDISPKA